MSASYRYSVGRTYADVASAFSQNAALRLPEARVVSHQELNDAANRMAAIFVDRGLRRRDVIAIVHTKTVPCYAAMLAALKLGAAYVNLDDQNPPARLKHILATAQPSFIFADEQPPLLASAFRETRATLLLMSDPDLAREYAHAPASEPSSGALVTGADPAYIMYTSGSTGVPKGALITHANILQFGAWAGSRFGIGPSDTLTNVNPMYFDNSVFDFYGSLLNGSAMAPMTRETVSSPSVLLEQVEAAGCTVWFSVPSLLIYLTTLKLLTPDRLSSIRAFVFGGEAYPKPELRKLFAAYGHRSRLINVYGPTECTCICSAWDVRALDLDEPKGLVTLGPIAENFSMLVLAGDAPVSPGEVGELCLLGPQVGLGYVNDAERTSRAFVRNPLNARWDERMYRTGDLVRLGDDGTMLDFVGRSDNQIKHMGYRIELEEVEAALNGVEGVVQSAVLHRSGRRETKRLVAYVAVDRTLSEATLRARLADFLPPYMIPQQLHIRTSLPKNANGKVDRHALAAEEVD